MPVSPLFTTSSSNAPFSESYSQSVPSSSHLSQVGGQSYRAASYQVTDQQYSIPKQSALSSSVKGGVEEQDAANILLEIKNSRKASAIGLH